MFCLRFVLWQADELTASLNYLKLNFIDYIGQDKQGQHIFAIYACRLPNRQALNFQYFIRLVADHELHQQFIFILPFQFHI